MATILELEKLLTALTDRVDGNEKRIVALEEDKPTVHTAIDEIRGLAQNTTDEFAGLNARVGELAETVGSSTAEFAAKQTVDDLVRSFNTMSERVGSLAAPVIPYGSGDYLSQPRVDFNTGLLDRILQTYFSGEYRRYMTAAPLEEPKD